MLKTYTCSLIQLTAPHSTMHSAAVGGTLEPHLKFYCFHEPTFPSFLIIGLFVPGMDLSVIAQSN